MRKGRRREVEDWEVGEIFIDGRNVRLGKVSSPPGTSRAEEPT